MDSALTKSHAPDLLDTMSPPGYPSARLLSRSEVPDLRSGQNGKEQAQSKLGVSHFGDGKLKADGSLVLSQARPCSLVPGPVAKSVMTPSFGVFQGFGALV